MFKKQQRLQGKDVRFLTRKRQVFSHGIFTIFFVEQYVNRKFHQISFHIPLAVSKKAILRHKIKRILISSFEDQLEHLDFGGKYYKCFITLHKMKLQPLLEIIAAKDTIHLKSYLQSELSPIFTSFAHFVGKKTTPSQKK